MKHLVWISALVLATLGGTAVAQDKAALAAEGKALIMEFGGALKAELKAGIEAGGPVSAIGFCNESAPEIAGGISRKSGWSVGRSSHKLRNTDNAPDAFTTATIDDFLARQAAGEAVETLARAEIVEENGQQVFRLVKAIPTGKLCLNCHGAEQVKPAIIEKLTELYPEDMARGFTEGEMRGVFTLSKLLN